MRILRSKFARFFVACVGTIIFLIVGSYLLFSMKLGSAGVDTLERCANMNAKVGAVAATAGRKIVFVGGSAVNRGINAEKVGEALGISGANFGTFASLGPPIMLYNAKQFLRAGDVVVLTFEYDLFWHNKPTAEEIDYILGCGRDYYDSLPLKARFDYVMGVDPSRLLVSRNGNYRQLTRARARQLSDRGDLRLVSSNFKPVTNAQVERMKLYRPVSIRFDPQSRDVLSIRSFVEWAKSHGVVVVATWPNTVYFQEYIQQREKLSQIRNFYNEMGVPVIGSPEDSMFPLPYFYDTQYHMNIKGITIRTRRLARAFKEYASKNRNGNSLLMRGQD